MRRGGGELVEDELLLVAGQLPELGPEAGLGAGRQPRQHGLLLLLLGTGRRGPEQL